MKYFKKWCNGLGLLAMFAWFACTAPEKKEPGLDWTLQVDKSGRYFQTANGQPFFWLGETGWLLFGKLGREDAEKYLETRRQQGFNVIQVMVLHTLGAVNVYGDSALHNQDVSNPAITPGNDPADSLGYDFWDHIDFVIDKAAEKGIYMGLVPVWGGNVKGGHVTEAQAKTYATFLAERFKTKPNIIWLNGGDISGADSIQVWKTIGQTIDNIDTGHLITYHPRGRMSSSQWFHNETWLDFNMFQSGHKDYAQDTMLKDFRFGEDNWRHIQMDYARMPVKPTLDGEPSYEEIPHGLHDTTGAYWTANDVRRYAYWSVLAGGAGFTYGHNAVMQMHRPGDTDASFGPKSYWYDGINHTGAQQMKYLKALMLSVPFQEAVPDHALNKTQGSRYDYQPVLKGKYFLMVYTYNGRNIQLDLDKAGIKPTIAQWYNPRNGEYTEAAGASNAYDPPGEQVDGNDWVLLIKWK